MTFDYLIVGAGLFGAVCARELMDVGKSVKIVERRKHIAGNCHTETRGGQVINLYGGHIYHTNDRRLWEYVNRFAEFRQYSHHVKARVGETVFSFPPNRMTYQQLGTDSADVVREMFFTGYTEKMWSRPIAEVPADVLKRIPTRADWNDEYFSDRYQGMPVNGYTPMIERMLDGADVRLGVDYLADRWALDQQADAVIYTGPIDALFGCDRGALEWRGLSFCHWRHDAPTYQGCATMNYPARDVVWLRDEEWRYFYPPSEPLGHSWVTRTYPGGEGAYPINDSRNNALAKEYQERAHAAGYLTGGRLADYRYYDMHQTIAAALHLVKNA